MQISDLFRTIGQQQNNVGQNQTIAEPNNATGVSANSELSGNSIQEYLMKLKPGEVFEGSILSMNQGKVMIALADGNTFQARMDQGVQLQQGEATFFQVKSNENGQIGLKAVSQELVANKTLVKALQSAGIQVNDRTLIMVKEMMKHQLPIDAKSVANMSRTLFEFPQTSVKTLVQLKELKLPINDVNIEQLEHQQSGEGKVSGNIENVLKQLPGLVSGANSMEESLKLLKELIAVFNQDGERILEGENQETQKLNEPSGESKQPEWMTQEDATGVLKTQDGQEGIVTSENVSDNKEVLANNPTVTQEESVNQKQELEQRQEQALEQVKTLLKEPVKSGEALKQLQKFVNLLEDSEILKQDYKKHIFGKDFGNLLKKVADEQWFMKPEEFAEKEKLSEFYRKLDVQLEKFQKVLEQNGKGGSELAKPIADTRGNLSFMNQINQMYHYVQVPLKMANQKATGELFVYTNKRSTRKQGDEVSAHLHLEMEHLGTTDVYVKLIKQKLTTNFMLEKEESLDLVMEHIDILTDRLTKKGYDVSIDVKQLDEKQTGKPVEFSNEVLGKQTTDVVSRYSFDVKI